MTERLDLKPIPNGQLADLIEVLEESNVPLLVQTIGQGCRRAFIGRLSGSMWCWLKEDGIT